MSKFNVRVAGCSGAVVIGDQANLTIGAPGTDGKCRKFSLRPHALTASSIDDSQFCLDLTSQRWILLLAYASRSLVKF